MAVPAWNTSGNLCCYPWHFMLLSLASLLLYILLSLVIFTVNPAVIPGNLYCYLFCYPWKSLLLSLLLSLAISIFISTVIPGHLYCYLFRYPWPFLLLSLLLSLAISTVISTVIPGISTYCSSKLPLGVDWCTRSTLNDNVCTCTCD